MVTMPFPESSAVLVVREDSLRNTVGLRSTARAQLNVGQSGGGQRGRVPFRE
ncbi:MAG: hypothetical protein JWQ68_2430 [Cryobacterium sp.]|jgi:hypothetical protein|nr:hypothetical protein [Cryobacterium sp.]